MPQEKYGLGRNRPELFLIYGDFTSNKQDWIQSMDVLNHITPLSTGKIEASIG
jgi:hypothetical protein